MGILQALRLENQKLRILEILYFHPCNYVRMLISTSASGAVTSKREAIFSIVLLMLALGIWADPWACLVMLFFPPAVMLKDKLQSVHNADLFPFSLQLFSETCLKRPLKNKYTKGLKAMW